MKGIARTTRCSHYKELIESADNQAHSAGIEATCSQGQPVYNKSALTMTP